MCFNSLVANEANKKEGEEESFKTHLVKHLSEFNYFATRSMSKKSKIILIDDDESSNIVNALKLKDAYPNYELTIFTSPLEFFSEVNNREFGAIDFVLLDLNMPIMTGWDVLRKFESLAKPDELRTIILTSSINQSDKDEALSFSRVFGFIVKPFTIAKLQTLVSQL